MMRASRWVSAWLPALVIALAAVLLQPAACAQDQQPIPPLTGQVVDRTGTLSAAQQQSLRAQLSAFERRKGSQIAVLIVPRTAPETIEQYAIRVAEQWQIGRKQVDDGALLVIARDERRLRIEVGYGLEGALNDATARRIIDEVIVPYLRAGDLAAGVEAGVEAMMRVIDGEPLPPPRPDRAGESQLPVLLPVVFIVALTLGGLLRAALGRGRGAVASGGLLGVAVWLFSGIFLLGLLAAFIGFVTTLGGGRMGSGWHGRRGGFGSYGPSGGRGFGGGFRGGGGGFGGGGASGRW